MTKTFAVPVTYFISDDNEVTPMVYIQPALTKEKAQELVISEIKAEEIENNKEVNDVMDIAGDESMIPSIWIDGEESDEEGFIIGNIKNIVTL